MSKRKYIIGVDLGGTWVRAALSDEKGKIMEKVQEKVDVSSEKAISNQIVKIVCVLCNRSGVDITSLEGVGIASAGPLDIKEGALINPTNLPFDYVPLTRPISEQLGVPTFLINDCTAAVLGERIFGAGKGLDNLVYITIGTGIGGGAIVDGHLLLGKDGNAVEIGHITIDYEGRLECGCGKRGHWEAYCSGRNIPNYVRMRLEEVNEELKRQSLLFKKIKGELSQLSSQDLFEAAKRGDKLSLQLVEEIGVLNAMGFANVINAYDPSLITVGGTVALKNEELILPPIRKYVKNYAVNRLPKIIVTPLGENIGIYGGISIVLKLKSRFLL
ncbi:ROK family protein [Candidatus Bathyarchaeota archaeon]|nr:ROK family protein [Candidatus Bathyarchaeota archaeon]